MSSANNGGHDVNWQTIIASGILVVTLFGANWTVQQQQSQWMREQINEERVARVAQIKDRDELIGIERSVRLKNDSELRSELETKLSRNQFDEHSKRLIDSILVLREQLKVLESTRPTTGELQSAVASLRDRIEKLYVIFVKQQELLNKIK